MKIIPKPLLALLVAGVILVILSLASFPALAGNEKIVRTIIAEEVASTPIIILYESGVYYEKDSDGIMVPKVGPRIVFAAWDDGVIVWSGSSIRGGSPYSTAVVDTGQLEETLTRICETADNLPEFANTDYRGPGSPAMSILVKSEVCSIYWHSWHEVWEASGKHVALERGIYPLPPGETVKEARANYSSPQHLAFIEAWNEVKETALGLIPEDPSEAGKVELTLRYHWTTMVLDP